jgi:hypothetical protein
VPEFLEIKLEDVHLKRFWSKVKKSEECWEWIGDKNQARYGRIKIKTRLYMAHRVSYLLAHGVMPQDLTVDHICFNHGCVNPAHLQLLTLEENGRRQPPGVISSRTKTHCKWGHEFTAESTYHFVHLGKPHRQCWTCIRIRDERRRVKRIEQRLSQLY